MNKQIFLPNNKFKLIIVILLLSLSSCNRSNNKDVKDAPDINNHINENIHIEENRIYIDVILYDTVQTRLFFDTGSRGMLNIWRDFAGQYQTLNPDTRRSNNPDVIQLYKYPASSIIIDSVSIEYPVTALSKPILESFAESCSGMFSPDYKTENRVWCFDFEHNSLTIKDSCDFIPEESAIFPMTFSKDSTILFIELPLILSNGRDSMMIEAKYIFDTGTPCTIVYNDPKYEMEVFDSLFTNFQTKNRLYIFQDNVIDYIIPPSPMNTIYEQHIPINHYWGRLKGTAGTLGVNFIKHYNVWMDFKEKRFIFSNHDKKYSNYRRNDLGFWTEKIEEEIVVGAIVIGSPAEIAGVKIDDIIIRFNGIKTSDISKQQIDSIGRIPKTSDIEFLLKRGKDTMQLKFPPFDNPLNNITSKDIE